METLVQPIFSPDPEPGHQLADVLTLEEFVKLLREEEDYWEGEQHNTKLIITRLRKIFYDQWGWNTELIRGAAKIEGRYLTEIVDDPVTEKDDKGVMVKLSKPHHRAVMFKLSKPVPRYVDNEYQPKHRTITYRPDDRVYGNTRAGQTPFIYKNDHQEVILPEGFYCDVAHILAGLDAFNHPQIVTPLPNFLTFAARLFPHVDSNMDIVTWLGDIASSSGDFFFDYLNHKKKPLTTAQEQHYIDIDAPGSDMLGDIDPYVIRAHYDVSATKGQRFTDILLDYYSAGNKHRRRRTSIYCEQVGLKGWDGKSFSNEKEWLAFYKRHLKFNTCFQVFSLTDEKLRSVWLPAVVWFGWYKDVLKFEPLLEIYLKALKENIKKES